MEFGSKEWWRKHWPYVAAAGAVLLGLWLYVRARSAPMQPMASGGLSSQQAQRSAADSQLAQAGLAAQVQEDALATQAAEQKVAADLSFRQTELAAQTQQQRDALAAGVATASLNQQSSAISGALANQRNATTLKFLGDSIIPAIQRYLPAPAPAGGSLVTGGSTGGLNPDTAVFAPTAEEAAAIGAPVPIPADVAAATGGFAGF